MPSGERLPEQNAGRPDVRLPARPACRRAAPARCTRASRARRPAAVSVSSSRERARARSRGGGPSRRSSVSRTFAGFTSRWTIPRACAWASPSRICAAASIARVVVELAALERVPERAAGDVLVGDVDVAVVARERVGAQAGGCLSCVAAVASRSARGPAVPSRGTILSATSRPVALVERVPDGAHPAAARAGAAAGSGRARGRARQAEPRPPPSARAGFPRQLEILFAPRGMGYTERRIRCKRPMTEHDDELDFDFFDDEPATRTVVRRSARRASRRGRRRRPAAAPAAGRPARRA